MAKTRKKKTVKKTVSKKSKTNWSNFGWFILMLTLKGFGIAFLVQGFVIQLSTGLLYSGLFHYLLGLIFVILGWVSMKKML